MKGCGFVNRPKGAEFPAICGKTIFRDGQKYYCPGCWRERYTRLLERMRKMRRGE